MFLSVLCTAPAPAQDCQKRLRRRPGGKRLSAYVTAHNIMFSTQKKTLYATNLHSKGYRSCSDTSKKFAHFSLCEGDTSSSCEPEISKSTSGAKERSACDRAWKDLELLLNLVRSETRPSSAAELHCQTTTATTRRDSPSE